MGRTEQRTTDDGYERRVQAALEGIDTGKYKSFRQGAKEENVYICLYCISALSST